MTVSSSKNRIQYASGSTSYAFPYLFYADSELTVYVNTTQQVLNTDYTVSGAGNSSGGTITFNSVATGQVTIIREVPFTQPSDYVNNSKFDATVLEKNLDELTFQAQQLAESKNRTLKLHITSPYADITVPDPKPGQLLKWKTDLSGLENVDVATSWATLASTAQGQGSALVGDSSGATVHDLLPIHLQFATYADLRNYSHIQGVDIVQITGDGIAGIFKADPSDTTTADNGGTVIVAADGMRWKRLHDGTVTPLMFGAVGDGATDSHVAFQAAVDAMSAEGGGSVYVPAGHYVFTGAQASLLMRSNVELYGCGPASFIDSVWNTLNFAPGARQYVNYTWYGCNAIAADQNTITLTTAADAANFSVGDLIILRSTTLDNGINFPEFVEMVKITAINSGVLTLEYAIEEAVPSPTIGKPTTANGGPLIENVLIHDLKLKGDYTQGSEGIRTSSGFYKSKIWGITTDGALAYNGNLITRSSVTIDHATVHFNGTNANNCRILEIKSGSYKSDFLIKEAVIINENGATAQIAPIDVGERARANVVSAPRVYAPEINVSNLMSQTQAKDTIFTDIGWTAVKNIDQVIDASAAHSSSGNFAWDIQGEAEHVRANVLGSVRQSVAFSDQSRVNNGWFPFKNVRVTGTPGDPYNKGYAIGSIIIPGTINGITTHDCVMPGQVDVRGSSDTVFYNSHFGIPSANGRFIGCTYDAEPSKPGRAINRTVSSNTANNSLCAINLPPGALYQVGDYIDVDVFGHAGSNTGNANIALGSGATVFHSITEGSNTTFTLKLRATVTYINGSQITYRINGTLTDTTGTAINDLFNGFDVSGSPNVEVQAWLGTSGDTVYIAAAEIKYVPVYEQ